MQSIKLVLLLVAICAPLTHAQFKCTLQASSDEDSCLKTVGDDDQHCAWCSLGGFAFCLSEQVAEAMEQNLHAQCERFAGNDDDSAEKTDDDSVVPPAPGADDVFPSNDDAASSDDDKHKPKTDDDKITPTDDQMPDNFWSCLQEKDKSSCDSQGCTWCSSSKGGFSLCMTGPAAEQAESSTFFDCDNKDDIENSGDFSTDGIAPFTTTATARTNGPFDSSCVKAFLDEQTEDACTHAKDEDGDYCKWCSLAGMTNLCLTPEQADKGQALGITCLDMSTSISASTTTDTLKVVAAAAPLYDTACIMSYLQDQSSTGCAQAVDSEGSPCEFCPILNGAMNLCLTMDQVSLLEQSGMPCQSQTEADALMQQQHQSNPYDTSCIAASFSGVTDKDACVSTMDDDGKACRFCNVGGMASLCLTDSQADLAGGYGVSCENDEVDEENFSIMYIKEVQDNPYDTSCIMAFLQDQSEESCTSAMDQDGDACKFCTLQGAVSLCLTPSQADMADGMGVECNEKSLADGQAATLRANDFFDMSCVKAYLSDQSEDTCRGTSDEDGASCKWCHTPQSGDICLTAAQGDIAGQIGMWCDDADSNSEDLANAAPDALQVGLPDDFWACLQNFDESGCSPSCTWCDTSVGMGFCLSTPVAESTKECTFFDCNFKSAENKDAVDSGKVSPASSIVNNSFDPTCLGAGMGSDDAEQVCSSTVDGSGNACVWCNAAGVFGVCVSSDQASSMGEYLQCSGYGVSPFIAVS